MIRGSNESVRLGMASQPLRGRTKADGSHSRSTKFTKTPIRQTGCRTLPSLKKSNMYTSKRHMYRGIGLSQPPLLQNAKTFDASCNPVSFPSFLSGGHWGMAS